MAFDVAISDEDRPHFSDRFDREVAVRFGMTWSLWDAAQRERIGIFVSRQEHCLLDLLWRWRRGELDGEITVVASNHPGLGDDVAAFGFPCHPVLVTPDTKPAAEALLLRPLGGVDVVVLARYMQTLSGDFLSRDQQPSLVPAGLRGRPASTSGRASAA